MPPPSAVPAVIVTPKGRAPETTWGFQGQGKAGAKKSDRVLWVGGAENSCKGTVCPSAQDFDASLPASVLLVGPGVLAGCMKVDSAAVQVPPLGPWLPAMLAAPQSGWYVDGVV